MAQTALPDGLWNKLLWASWYHLCVHMKLLARHYITLLVLNVPGY